MVRYKVRPESLRDLVPLRGGDRSLPRHFAVEIEHEGPAGHPSVRLEFEMRDGAPQCRSILVKSTTDGGQIRSTHLKAVRVEDLLELAAKAVAMSVTEEPGGAHRVAPVITVEGDRDSVRQVREARSRTTVTPALLTEVAAVYLDPANVAAPTKAVEEHFGKSYRTAALYVQRARHDGYLDALTAGPVPRAQRRGKP